MRNNFDNLFGLFQKLDYRDKDSSSKKKLTGILLGYLIANTALSYSFYISFNEKSFVILSMTSNLFLLAMIVLTDFENLFLASRSIDLLKTLPLQSESAFSAKFISAILFLFLFILASSLPQVFFFYFFSEDILKSLAFLFSVILFCYFSVGILLLIYVFALKYFRNKASLVINILQIVFFFFIFYSMTLTSKMSEADKDQVARQDILDLSAVKYLPQTFFADGVFNVFYFIFSICLSVFIFAMLYLIVSKNYYSILEQATGLSREKKLTGTGHVLRRINDFIDKYILRNNYERASFNLVRYQLRNSKFLRAKYIPLALMPLVFVVIGIVTESPHLLFFNKGTGTGSFFKTAILVMSPSITFTLIMCSRLMFANTKILDENSAGTVWVYDSLPVTNERFIINGAMKFVYCFFIIPVIISITVLLSFRADIATVLLNVMFVTSGIYFINSVAMLFDKTYPFTLESTKFNSASKFAEVFLSMFLGIVLFLIQIFVFQNIIFALITTSAFIVVSLLLNRK